MIFPRLHRRGPIEALNSRGSGRLLRAFHGFTAVAPLKRVLIRDQRRPLRRFPRLHRRGPIEAPSRSTTRILTLPFHGFTAVAPLNLFVGRSPGGFSRPFHGFTAVAPLKDCEVEDSPSGSSPFPRGIPTE